MGVISYPDYSPVSLMVSSLFLPSWLAGLSVWVSCSRAAPHTSCPSRPCSHCHSLKRPGRWSYRISKLVGWSGCLHVGSFPWFLSSCNVDLVPLPPQLCWLCSLVFHVWLFDFTYWWNWRSWVRGCHNRGLPALLGFGSSLYDGVLSPGAMSAWLWSSFPLRFPFLPL